jgi:hypothetical protein
MLLPVVFAQWDDCARSEVNCTGECGAFIDTDASGYCDHSEPGPSAKSEPETAQTSGEAPNELISGQELKTKTVQEVADLYGIGSKEYSAALSSLIGSQVKPQDSFLTLHDNLGLRPADAKQVAVDLASGMQDRAEDDEQAEKKSLSEKYYFLPLSLLVTAIYIASFILAKYNRLKMATHKMIWNTLLGISFFISGVLGILLVIRINYGITFPLPFNMLFWHVEFGIVLFLIAVFHILWHWQYFLVMAKKFL